MILTAGLTPPGNRSWSSTSCAWAKSTGPGEAHGAGSARCSTRASPHRLGGPSLTLATVGGPPLAEITATSRPWASLPLDRHPGRHAGLHYALGPPRRHDHRAGRERTPLDRGPARPLPHRLCRRGRPGRRGRGHRLAAAGTRETFYRELLALTPCPAVSDFRGEGLLGSSIPPLRGKPNREELGLDRGPSAR